MSEHFGYSRLDDVPPRACKEAAQEFFADNHKDSSFSLKFDFLRKDGCRTSHEKARSSRASR